MSVLQMESVKYVLMAAVVSYVLFMLYLFQKQINNIRGQVNTSDFLLPMCQTLSEMFQNAEDTTALLRSLENSKFRNIWVTAFNVKGEVWADGYTPCYGKLPMPPTEVQKATYDKAIAAGVLDENKNSSGLLMNLFQKCELTGKKCVKLIAVQKVPDKDIILCLQRCG